MLNNEPAQSSPEAVTSSSCSALPPTSADGRLSQDDVLRRLFAPAHNLPENRSKHAIVIVSAGVERAVSHSRLEELIAHAIDELKKRGVKEGDKVAFYCENSPELSSTIMACWALNAMAALIDYRAERSAVLTMCKKLGARLLVTSKKLYKHFASESTLFTEEGLDVLDVSSFIDVKDKAQTSQFDITSVDLDKPALAILTSGTTGNPKTSAHNLRSLVRNIIDLASAVELQADMTALTPLPISHIYGLSVFLVTQVLGIKSVLTDLDPVVFVKSVHRHKPQLIAALPQFYGALLSAPKGAIDLKDSKLLLCGGAPLAMSLASKFEKTFGKQLNNGYGSTESKIVALNSGGPPLSVGKPIGSAVIEVVNEQGEVVPEGKIGEVRISGPMLMDGYLGNEDETEKVLRKGQYYTGDIGRFENGYLFVVGRKGDVMLVDSVVVYAGEVEEALRNNPNVKEVAVSSIKHKHLGEIIKAHVVLLDEEIAGKLKSNDRNESLSAYRQLQRQYRGFCKESLSRYQRPMKWEFLGPHDKLPKTLAGKVDKKSL